MAFYVIVLLLALLVLWIWGQEQEGLAGTLGGVKFTVGAPSTRARLQTEGETMVFPDSFRWQA